MKSQPPPHFSQSDADWVQGFFVGLCCGIALILIVLAFLHTPHPPQ